ncbi:MAG: GH92 family glycosyl hydrolase [Planctomycetota bacterium]
MIVSRQILFIIFFAILPFFQSDPAKTASAPASRPSDDVNNLVNVFIGTAGTGHTFPGATTPFGMVQLSPDTRDRGWENCSGYHSSNPTILGFSHTHLSGTGCADLGDILIVPTEGKLQLTPGDEAKPETGYRSRFRHETETGSPGYYSVVLDDHNIRAELSATTRCGMHRYTFPDSENAHILFDLDHGLDDQTTDSGVTIEGKDTISGFRRSTGWAKNQIIYFYAKFNVPFDSFGIANAGEVKDGLTSATGKDIKAYLNFRTKAANPVIVKVGISYVDVDGARKNLASEIPHFDFDAIRTRAENLWDNELSKISVEGGTHDDRVIFYTALYHCFIAPNMFTDVDGRYLGMDGNVKEAKNFQMYHVFSLWDTFRALHPLFTIIQQKRNEDFVVGLYNKLSEAGSDPIWELAANETNCMIGSHGYAVMADAFSKDLRSYIRKPWFGDRGNLPDLLSSHEISDRMRFGPDGKHRLANRYFTGLGYIPADRENEAVSKSLEYSYNSWNLGFIYKLSTAQISDDFQRRAKSYIHNFDAKTGFFRAKKNGNWVEPFDPREVNGFYTEANAWQYNFFVPHDISGLIQLHGGDEPFIRKLDQLFNTPAEMTGRHQADITGMIGQYAHGNEPSHHVAYLYSYAGAPEKTAERVRQIIDTMYKNTRDGLCGNDDCGQMSAWLVFSMMGLYPVCPGNTQYTLGSPVFEKVSLKLDNGSTFIIEAASASPSNRYIQNATFNNKPFESLFIYHSFIETGGTLVLQMGEKPGAIGKWKRPKTEIPENYVMIPFFRTGGRSFLDAMIVEIGCYTPEAKIYFTFDEDSPAEKWQPYEKPFEIFQTTKIRTHAFKDGFVASPTETVKFIKLPYKRSIQYKYPYSHLYTAGGDNGLLDGVHAEKESYGEWQGFEGVDFEATVDLYESRSIQMIASTYLQDYKSWIFLPSSVEYFVSVDGVKFESVGMVKNDVSPNSTEAQPKTFSNQFDARKARYVKIIAKNLGSCPPGHPGEGGKCWIFADEIEIR